MAQQKASDFFGEEFGSHSELYNAREKATTQAEQDSLANQEHRAFAREAVGENPLMAVPLLAAIPGYQAAKVAGLTNSRSSASLEQASEAYKGVGDGLKKAGMNALEFFGIDFSAPEPKKAAAAKEKVTEGSWDEINKKYAAGHEEREKDRLKTLEMELASEHDPATRVILKREIKRVKNG